MAPLKLFFSPGACSRVPLIILEKIGCEFDTELVVMKRGDHKQPAFLKLNPAGKVPVLQVGADAISQNAAIQTWLSETFPDAGVLPAADTPLQRSHNLSRLVRFSGDLHPLVTRIRLPQIFCDLDGSAARVKEMAMRAMAVQLRDYESRLSHQDWLSGAEWCGLDAYLHWIWFRITGAGFPAADFPAISSHYQRTLDQPAFQRALKREREAQDWLDENGFSITFPDP